MRAVDPLAFIASVVSSLAWPVAAVSLALIFRRPVGRMLERLPKRVKVGPVEVEWSEVATEARVALATSPEATTAAPHGSLTERFAGLAETEPHAAVMAAWTEVDRALREAVGGLGLQHPSVTGTMLAHIARENGAISEQTATAIRGLLALRNLAAHGPANDLDREKALDFLTLADAVLFAIQTRRPKGR